MKQSIKESGRRTYSYNNGVLAKHPKTEDWLVIYPHRDQEQISKPPIVLDNSKSIIRYSDPEYKMFKKLFQSTEIAKAYKNFRPTYPASVTSFILQYIDEKLTLPESRRIAVDVGCGSGQSTELLASHFQKIVGIDISEAQITVAKKENKFKHIEYKVGSFDQLPFEDSSVSLVYAGIAAHWFEPIENFYKEVDRILIPGGCLLLFGYSESHIKSFSDELNKDLDQLLEKFSESIDKYKTPKFEIVRLGYKNWKIPFDDSGRNDSLKLQKEMTLESYSGYLSSWSPYRQFLAKESSDPLQDFCLK
ncbi:DgyrCDS3930 [Dimorphilus gyrociliatus]|uniref:DgyrCDS3930 n=1 Tax=Dimorphilus gyrociliatus TaxID=2664684 RepID=A0A7I8VF41_9ANNE|nr:DgyrCDS3930 [Dimorphilus gyrociliatus]